MKFDYDSAFARNKGLINTKAQKYLRSACVGIVGLGGTGGGQALALARMGVGKFSIADPDVFELVNFNRQLGATMKTLGRPKTEVIKEMILEINPEAEVRVFSEGITDQNTSNFLRHVDVVVDSLDFRCLNERKMLYRQARYAGRYVFTAPPLGFGFSVLSFDWHPTAITFEDYFGLKPDMDHEESMVRFICGLSPKPYMARYLDRSLEALPSISAAPFMVAGAIASEVTNHLLESSAKPAPYVYQFDAKRRKFYSGTYNHKSIRNRFFRYFVSKLLKGKL